MTKIKKLKKVLAGILLGSLALTAAACGNSAPAGTQPAAKSDQPAEIQFWYSLSGKNGEKIQSMVEEFNKSQNEVKVTATYQGNYYENHAKVLAAIAAGNQPDVTMVEIASVASFANAGALEELKPYAEGKNGTDLNDYVPGLMGNSYWKDKLYAIPFARSTPLLYLNKDMLKKAGLNPEGPKTWEELRQFSKAMTKKEGDKQTYGFSTPIDIWFYEALVFESGGKILSEDGKQLLVNNKEGIAPLSFWKSMLDEGVMKFPPGEKYNAWEVAENDFANGTVGMIFTSTGSLGSLLSKAKFDLGTAFLPANKDYGVPTGGANFVILAKSSKEKKEAAWKFVKWMTDTKQTTSWSQTTGYMPVRTSALNSEEMKKYYQEKPQFKVAVEQLKYAKPRPAAPGYKELQEVIMSEIQRAILGKATPEEALNTAADKGTKLLKK